MLSPLGDPQQRASLLADPLQSAGPIGTGRVAVVGGGITGLAAAHRLVELGIDVTLLERSRRCGGVILTETLDGFLVEAGPDSFLARKPWASALCRRLGLEGEILPADPARRGAFVWFSGRLHPLPEGLTSLVPTRLVPLARTRLLSPAGKARLLMEPLLPRGHGQDDESLAGFFRRRLGQEASRRLVEPLVRGIYGGDPERLSLRATFPQLAEIERRHGSLVRGLLRESRGAKQAATPGSPAFLSLRRGMGALVERLLEVLPAGAVRTEAGVGELSRTEDGRFELLLEGGGGRLDADAVIVTSSAAETGRLIRGLDPVAAAAVSDISAGASLIVALGFSRERVRHPLDGYGFVVSEASGGPLLACTWSSSKFAGRAPEGSVLLRVFLAEPEALAGLDDRAVTEVALAALRPILGLEGPPRLARVHRWRDALPRYAVGHPERVAEVASRLEAHPGLFLAGASYRGVGVPDCVREGEAAAVAARDHLAHRPSFHRLPD